MKMPQSVIASLGFHGVLLFGLQPWSTPPEYGVEAGRSSPPGRPAAGVLLVKERKESPPPTTARPPDPVPVLPVPDVKQQSLAENNFEPDPAPSVAAAQGVAGSGDSAAPSTESNGVESARPFYLKNPPPVYPEKSRRLGHQGVVLLRVRIGSAGEVEQVEILKGSGFVALDESACRAVRRWRFRPASLAGIPVVSNVEVPVRFQLR